MIQVKYKIAKFIAMASSSSLSNNNDSDILQCGFCDMWGTMVQIFNHMKKEHPQSFDDDIVDSDESNHENNIKTTNSDEIKSGRSVDEWGEPETKFLLSKYNDYMISVGPRKTFRTVKSMFQRISEDLKEELDITRSWWLAMPKSL
ncbi:uncharacterized protein [Linepithema humile]|uniref:uncharacterized protein n=1 Tax=Linepithema humile TaxID=83485 RepID=UPI00351F05C2